MKFIHLADMHFDTTFSIYSNFLCEKRRLEQRESLKKVIDYIKENNIQYLFISGDLYENENIRRTTIEYINNLFKEIPNTKIFISPGNHDPYLKNSYYNTFKWNENVYIFKDSIEQIEDDGIDIYGYGFGDFNCAYSGVEDIVIKNKDKINILVAHGTLDGSKTSKQIYNPIAKNKLAKIGFDYIALGHIHKTNYQSNSNIIYPGSTNALGFDELGEHGVIEGNILKNKLELNFIKIDKREYKEIEIDISAIYSQEEIVEKINAINFNENNLYKIVLSGQRNFSINLFNIFKLLINKNILKIKDNSKINLNITDENNLRNVFIKIMLEKIKNAPEEKEKFEKAMEIGLEIIK